MDFLETNGSLFEGQYGFRPGRSCEHALLSAQNHLAHNLSKNKISLLLLIDFSKAFDMVEYPILLNKLYHYGIRGIALEWFRSYLHDREQFVSVNRAESAKTNIKYGVPQGSILGPLLFIIYINDMPNIFKLAKFILYADDANIILTGNSIHEVEQQLIELLPILVQWVDLNGLKLNLKKTNYMIFSRTRITGSIGSIHIGCTEIKPVNETRFLGVIMDDKLNWSKHISAVKAKMSRYVGIMYRIKRLLPPKIRVQIYHSFVQSYLNFCSLVWGFTSKHRIESLFTAQKKGLRAAMPGNINYFYKDGNTPTHTKLYFKTMGILTVHNLISANALTFMHKINNFPQSIPASVRATIAHDAPKSGDNYEACNSWLHLYSNTPFKNTVFYKGPLIYADTKYANLISLATLMSFKSYRNRAKSLLLEHQSHGLTEEWEACNFSLYDISGLRRSARNRVQHDP